MPKKRRVGTVSARDMKIIPAFLLAILCATLSCQAEKIVEVVSEGVKEPFGTEFDSKGTMYVVEMIGGNRLFRVEEGGKLVHLAGRLESGYSGDGGPALEARFNGPHNLAVLPDGNILIGDTWNGVVRKVDLKSNTVSTLPGFQAPKGKERGNGPYCITLDHAGENLYIANLLQIHVVNLASGTCKVIAGNGKKGRPEDGAVAVDAPLVDPRAVAVDREGRIYILERGGNALRVVGQDGRIRTVVNASGKKGGEGDGGPALEATMNGPKHLCVDRDGCVIIADAESHLIRRYSPSTGRIERIAGTGKSGRGAAGGDPKGCALARPHGVSVHPVTGELFITDSYNHRVLKIVK